MNSIAITNYAIQRTVTSSFEETVKKLQVFLKDAGFGVLTTIDVKETFKKKLAVDYPKYMIFGICHPQSALKALQTDKDIGLLLPCNVIVYQDDKVRVSAIRPTVALTIVQQKELAETANEIEVKLQEVLKEL